MSRRSSRRRHEASRVNHERWLVSYADFITLLFAFFTTMYAISTVDAQKLASMVDSMQVAFDRSDGEPRARLSHSIVAQRSMEGARAGGRQNNRTMAG